MDEFELISRYFDRGKYRSDRIVVGIGDDGAVLQAAADKHQVQVIDTLVAGIHFPRHTAAADIGYRAVAVNASDIAAMGAAPTWMTLALSLPLAEDGWLADFASGLFAAADLFDVELVGGDTTSGSETVVTVAMGGEVSRGAAVLRSGARPGDRIFVSGTLGDAAAGLQLMSGPGECGPDLSAEHRDYLLSRFLRPTARLSLGRHLSGRATAAIDVSDGLLDDLGKLLQASGAGGRIDISHLPLSPALAAHADAAQCRQYALQGGDDYELCFTAPSGVFDNRQDVSDIGVVTETPGLAIVDGDDVVEIAAAGYRHFQ